MESYENPESGINFFENHKDAIAVSFKTGGVYIYDADKPGAAHVEKMKELASKHDGLNTYINKNVRKNFSGKFKDIDTYLNNLSSLQ